MLVESINRPECERNIEKKSGPNKWKIVGGRRWRLPRAAVVDSAAESYYWCCRCWVVVLLLASNASRRRSAVCRVGSARCGNADTKKKGGRKKEGEEVCSRSSEGV